MITFKKIPLFEIDIITALLLLLDELISSSILPKSFEHTFAIVDVFNSSATDVRNKLINTITVYYSSFRTGRVSLIWIPENRNSYIFAALSSNLSKQEKREAVEKGKLKI